MNKHSVLLKLSGLAALSLVGSAQAYAQASPWALNPRVVAVALVPQLPQLAKNDKAVVLRRSGVLPHDIILLPEATATPRLLDAAVRALVHARTWQGIAPANFRGKPFQELAIGIRAEAPPDQDALRLSRINGVLTALRSAAPTSVPGLGQLRTVQFYLPASAPR